MWYVRRSLATIFQRDNILKKYTRHYNFGDRILLEKKELVHRKGITLVTIPCWWEGDKERYYYYYVLSSTELFNCSVCESIHFLRPDLLPCTSLPEPISLNPPLDYFTSMQMRKYLFQR